MTNSEIISRIIELETPIVRRIVTDKTFKANECDEYQKNREELKILREKIKDIINPPSHLPGGISPQRPNSEELNSFRENQ